MYSSAFLFIHNTQCIKKIDVHLYLNNEQKYLLTWDVKLRL